MERSPALAEMLRAAGELEAQIERGPIFEPALQVAVEQSRKA